MACFHPLTAIQKGVSSSGKKPLIFSRVKIDEFVKRGGVPLLVGCGQCVGCKLEYSRQWAMRCMDEAKLHGDNSFLTLTYDNEHLPVDRSLSKRDFQLFMKRLRKVLKKKVKFYACGEYGEKFGRPHYHACVFGEGFRDRKFYRRGESGFSVYTSGVLEKCWNLGRSFVGDLTFESAGYVARYTVQKLTVSDGSSEEDRRRYYAKYLDVATGVLRTPEFNLMSRGGRKKGSRGIGYEFYEKYWSDMYPHGAKVVNGVECKTPRYYDSCVERESPEVFLRLKEKRKDLINVLENSLNRLLVREEVLLAKISKLRREFEYD